MANFQDFDIPCLFIGDEKKLSTLVSFYNANKKDLMVDNHPLLLIPVLNEKDIHDFFTDKPVSPYLVVTYTYFDVDSRNSICEKWEPYLSQFVSAYDQKNLIIYLLSHMENDMEEEELSETLDAKRYQLCDPDSEDGCIEVFKDVLEMLTEVIPLSDSRNEDLDDHYYQAFAKSLQTHFGDLDHEIYFSDAVQRAITISNFKDEKYVEKLWLDYELPMTYFKCIPSRKKTNTKDMTEDHVSKIKELFCCHFRNQQERCIQFAELPDEEFFMQSGRSVDYAAIEQELNLVSHPKLLTFSINETSRWAPTNDLLKSPEAQPWKNIEKEDRKQLFLDFFTIFTTKTAKIMRTDEFCDHFSLMTYEAKVASTTRGYDKLDKLIVCGNITEKEASAAEPFIQKFYEYSKTKVTDVEFDFTSRETGKQLFVYIPPNPNASVSSTQAQQKCTLM